MRNVGKMTKRISAFLLAFSLLSGCGKADKKEISEDLNSNMPSDVASQTDGTSAANEVIPETVHFLVGDDLGNVYIEQDLRVISEGYGNVPTYSVNKKDYNEEWLLSYADKFFDNGEYTAVKPYNNTWAECTVDELKETKQFYEELIAKYSDDEWVVEQLDERVNHINYCIENHGEDEKASFSEGTIIYSYESTYRQEDEEFTFEQHATGKASAELWGLHDGNLWVLRYNEAVVEYSDLTNNYQAIYMNQPEIHGICLEKTLNFASAVSESMKGDNICDKDTAEKEAASFIKALGINDMEIIDTKQCHDSSVDVDNNTISKKELNGYMFIYGYSKNGVSLGWQHQAYVYSDERFKAYQPCIMINISNQGVYGFCISNDYELETMAEKSEMISLEQVNEIAQATWKKRLEQDKTAPRLGYVKFQYICVTYDGEKFALVPAWTYYSPTDVVFGEDACFSVCALDGEVFYYDYANNSTTYDYGYMAYMY